MLISKSTTSDIFEECIKTLSDHSPSSQAINFLTYLSTQNHIVPFLDSLIDQYTSESPNSSSSKPLLDISVACCKYVLQVQLQSQIFGNPSQIHSPEHQVVLKFLDTFITQIYWKLYELTEDQRDKEELVATLLADVNSHIISGVKDIFSEIIKVTKQHIDAQGKAEKGEKEKQFEINLVEFLQN